MTVFRSWGRHSNGGIHMVSQKQVCVIGAGVWEPARSYPDVQTQSPKDLYRYTDQAMPDDYPEWPKGPQVHAYLTDYARSHGLDHLMRFNTAVVAMDRRADGKPGWSLELATPNGT